MAFSALDARLALAASFVRPGAVLADVGTDHAYLPAFLLSEKRARYAYCTDIADSPLSVARNNLETLGLAEYASFLCTDGLAGLEDAGITDVTICGMGGDTIVHILSKAPFLCVPEVRLILGPMTHAERVRAFLDENGFRTVGEAYGEAAGHAYVTICAEYDGRTRLRSDAQRETGDPQDVVAGRDVFFSVIQRKYEAAKRRALARASAGLSSADERELICRVETILKEREKLS